MRLLVGLMALLLAAPAFSQAKLEKLLIPWHVSHRVRDDPATM